MVTQSEETVLAHLTRVSLSVVHTPHTHDVTRHRTPHRFAHNDVTRECDVTQTLVVALGETGVCVLVADCGAGNTRLVLERVSNEERQTLLTR